MQLSMVKVHNVLLPDNGFLSRDTISLRAALLCGDVQRSRIPVNSVLVRTVPGMPYGSSVGAISGGCREKKICFDDTAQVYLREIVKVSISPVLISPLSPGLRDAYLTVTFMLLPVISNLTKWKQGRSQPGPQSLSYAAFTSG